jgi:integrase
MPKQTRPVRSAAISRLRQHELVGCAFQRTLERAGLRRMRFHDMRHACASLLIAQGVHPRVVMETLGHSQIGITMNLYSHVLPEAQRQAAAQMDAVLSRS